jgi:hypothetical protein
MDRAELVQHYVTLMGSDAEERGFYKGLASMTDAEIMDGIIHLAYYYQEEYNELGRE